MVNNNFEAYKVKREIKKSGVSFEFKRCKRNEFKEPIGEETSLGSFKGLYHEQSSGVQITVNEATQIRSKKTPMILCLYEDVAKLGLQIGDTTTMNGKTYKVLGFVNVQEWNIVADISLEVVDYGYRV